MAGRNNINTKNELKQQARYLMSLRITYTSTEVVDLRSLVKARILDTDFQGRRI